MKFPFIKRTVADLLKDELYETQRELLQATRAAEHYEAMQLMLTARVERLRESIAAEVVA